MIKVVLDYALCMHTYKRCFSLILHSIVCMHKLLRLNAYACILRQSCIQLRYKKEKRLGYRSFELKMHPLAVYSFIKRRKLIVPRKYKRSKHRSFDILLFLRCLNSITRQERSIWKHPRSSTFFEHDMSSFSEDVFRTWNWLVAGEAPVRRLLSFTRT